MPKTQDNSEDKKPGFLEDVKDTIENNPGEIRPEELHDGFLTVFNNLVEHSKKEGLPTNDKLATAQQVHFMYITTVGKEFAKEYLDKTDRTSNRAINELRKMRHDGKPPYAKDEDED